MSWISAAYDALRQCLGQINITDDIGLCRSTMNVFALCILIVCMFLTSVLHANGMCWLIIFAFLCSSKHVCCLNRPIKTLSVTVMAFCLSATVFKVTFSLYLIDFLHCQAFRLLYPCQNLTAGWHYTRMHQTKRNVLLAARSRVNCQWC